MEQTHQIDQPNQTDQIDKNIIDVTIYKININTELRAYTAIWCGPCKRIKPIVRDFMNKNNYNIIDFYQIDKSIFKKDVNEFVPFFQLIKKVYVNVSPGFGKIVDGDIIDSIQTSEEMKFYSFLSKNKITTFVLDNDF